VEQSSGVPGDGEQLEEETDFFLPTFHDGGAEYTLALIKPDATHKAVEIKDIITNAGFKLLREKRFVFSVAQAETFYNDHSTKPFFRNLVNFMTRCDGLPG
jgi:hypothetical protein